MGINEGAVEYAHVGSCVVEGHVADADGAILQVQGVVAASPAQAAIETWVNDFLGSLIAV